MTFAHFEVGEYVATFLPSAARHLDLTASIVNIDEEILHNPVCRIPTGVSLLWVPYSRVPWDNILAEDISVVVNRLVSRSSLVRKSGLAEAIVSSQRFSFTT